MLSYLHSLPWSLSVLNLGVGEGESPHRCARSPSERRGERLGDREWGKGDVDPLLLPSLGENGNTIIHPIK